MTRLWNQPQLAIRGTAVFGPGSAVIMDGFLFTSIALFCLFFYLKVTHIHIINIVFSDVFSKGVFAVWIAALSPVILSRLLHWPPSDWGIDPLQTLPWTHMDECPEGCWVIASHDCNPLNLNVANRPSQCIGLNELPYNGCQIKVQLWLRWEMICRKDDISKSLEQLSGLTVYLTVLRLLFKPSCPTASPISVKQSVKNRTECKENHCLSFSPRPHKHVYLYEKLCF